MADSELVVKIWTHSKGASKIMPIGDDIYTTTANWSKSAFNTVRGRFKKNSVVAADAGGTCGFDNVTRMQKELAPLKLNAAKGGWKSMEFSHELIPFRDGRWELRYMSMNRNFTVFYNRYRKR